MSVATNVLLQLQNQDPFVRALQDIELMRAAGHIAAFPVWCCSPETDAAELRLRVAKDAEDFSHVPVRDAGSKVVGVVYRDTLTGSSGTAASVMKELDQRQLVDATAPLRDTLSLLTHSGFLLVTSPTSGMPDRISGIIN